MAIDRLANDLAGVEKRTFFSLLRLPPRFAVDCASNVLRKLDTDDKAALQRLKVDGAVKGGWLEVIKSPGVYAEYATLGARLKVIMSEALAEECPSFALPRNRSCLLALDEASRLV